MPNLFREPEQSEPSAMSGPVPIVPVRGTTQVQPVEMESDMLVFKRWTPSLQRLSRAIQEMQQTTWYESDAVRMSIQEFAAQIHHDAEKALQVMDDLSESQLRVLGTRHPELLRDLSDTLCERFGNPNDEPIRLRAVNLVARSIEAIEIPRESLYSSLRTLGVLERIHEHCVDDMDALPRKGHPVLEHLDALDHQVCHDTNPDKRQEASRLIADMARCSNLALKYCVEAMEFQQGNGIDRVGSYNHLMDYLEARRGVVEGIHARRRAFLGDISDPYGALDAVMNSLTMGLRPVIANDFRSIGVGGLERLAHELRHVDTESDEGSHVALQVPRRLVDATSAAFGGAFEDLGQARITGVVQSLKGYNDVIGKGLDGLWTLAAQCPDTETRHQAVIAIAHHLQQAVDHGITWSPETEARN